MGRKRTKLSTISHVKESIVQTTGDLRTLRSNLTKLRADRIIYEREQLQSRIAVDATARQLLAEAALEAGTTNPDAHYFGDFDIDGNQDNMEEEDKHEEEGDEGDSEGHPVGGCEGPAVGAARAQVINCFQGKHHRRRVPRSRLHRNQELHAAWSRQMPDLIAAYLRWKLHEASVPPVDPGPFEFDVSTVDVFAFVSSTSIPQAAEEPANVSLINVGLIGCSPIQPTIAISLKCLKLYHQVHRRKPSFNIQAMVKVLCALHNAPLHDQFTIAFDVYLDILWHVQEKVNIALKRDSPDWRMLHACPACDYKQENESILLPGRMDSIDGNNSLKRVDGSGHADECIFRSSYLIPASEVDAFKDDVQLRPGTRRVAENSTPADATESICTDNWKTANTITDNTIKVFEQTGIFISACRHSMVQTIVEMRWSGELAKYALATTNRILDVYGPNGATGYDIGKFLYNNYKQALAIIDDLTPAVEELKLALKITDADFERWNTEELEFLENVAEESDEDIEAMAYVEALESLTRAQAAYGSITTVQFLMYTPADFTPSHGLQKDQQVFARAREAEWNAAYRKLLVEMNAVDDLERCMAVTE
ncbi:hypothetical protein BDR05DRAFT_1001795 [Suillus weaverae]|nr:hypothetical protein BDR05DRAFT_1001795 [Suillus weaverae]